MNTIKQFITIFCARFRKSSVLLIAIILTMGLMVGATVAYLVATSTEVTNTFTPSKVACEVIEDEFTDSVSTMKTNVKVQNTGDTEAYIRAAIIVTWKNEEDGNVYWKQPVEGVDYSITLAQDGGWYVETSDGYYYYTKPVAPNDNNNTTNTDVTGVLISSCSPFDANTPEGYGLNVEILASAIQSKPTSVVAEQWGVTVADDGTISK